MVTISHMIIIFIVHCFSFPGAIVKGVVVKCERWLCVQLIEGVVVVGIQRVDQ